MNKATYITMSIGALGVLIMLTLNRPDNIATTTPPQSSTPSSKPIKPTLQVPMPSSIQNRDDELTVRVESAVDLKALGIDPTPFKEMTSDPALIQILASFRPSQIGAMKQVGSSRVEVELDGGRRFAATQIGECRSMANDGTIALDAITTPDGTPIKNIDAKEGGVTASGNPSEIWIIDASGRAERLSPPHVHASRPVISPDGRYVAFTAQYLIGGALHSKVLMIKDRNTGELSSFAERKYGADYEIAPVDWVEGGKVLRVIEDWGETGGHMKLKQVRVQ
jgi:dipeptidyl aminopeptidase/acylaminoacyl peptidase